MTDPRTIVISANPKSGARSGLSSANALRATLESAGFLPELFTDIDAMAQRTRQLHEQGSLRSVVAAGGDGTASLVLSVIPHDVPLTLYPLGSENLLAKYFGIDLDLDSAVAMIERLDTKPIDLFEANGKPMLLMASVGFDAEVVRQVHRRRTSHVTRWSYRWSILSALWSYRWPRFRISTRDPEGKWRLDTPDTGMECSRRPQLSACIMSPRSMPVRVLALRASQYINPIIISMDGTAMTG
jgi:diacylglycerol kinase family enzyme